MLLTTKFPGHSHRLVGSCTCVLGKHNKGFNERLTASRPRIGLMFSRFTLDLLLRILIGFPKVKPLRLMCELLLAKKKRLMCELSCMFIPTTYCPELFSSGRAVWASNPRLCSLLQITGNPAFKSRRKRFIKQLCKLQKKDLQGIFNMVQVNLTRR
ncbi:hypothetical protein YC2023_023120 [Brassica napus]